jgi:hypothetical protein
MGECKDLQISGNSEKKGNGQQYATAIKKATAKKWKWPKYSNSKKKAMGK